MESIKKINESEEYAYYIPCNIPLIVKAVNRLGGFVYINLLANDGLVAVPNFILNSNNFPSSNVRFSKKINKMKLLNELGIHKKYGYFDNFKEGLEYLRSMNEQGKDVLLGVTSYYLPYSRDYINPKYIENYINRTIGVMNHYISVVDISHEKFKLYDVTENEHEHWIGIKDLNLAWKGDSQIEAFTNFPDINELRPFTYLEVTLEKRICERDLLAISIDLLKVIIEDCLSEKVISENGTSYFYGKSAIIEFLKYLKLYDFTDIKKNKSLSNCLIEMQISRYFLRDLIKDIAFLDDKFEKIYENIDGFSKEFTNIVYKFNFIISKKSVDKEKVLELSKKIYEIFESEQALYKGIVEDLGVSQ
ncbi:hypothetical protein KF134_1238 [Lactococcus lactis subsp. lactis]|uniref:hypothetical protein n=1 Tax=Lactococcus lactis TaxID=1358 RepID=UPI00071E25B8|nr:hypothetical protein [Lactococcus lactis]KST91464.1 hypothetical protein KF134_1238 [Lactococcus lactis subsp. lactis]